MAKLPRKTQKVFGSTAGGNQIAVIGSLAANAPAYSTDVATLQSLSNYLSGWFNVVLGGNSPTIEDMNALFYVVTAQLAYQFQSGVPEWDAGTTYYIGSIVSDGSANGALYVSLIDTNLNQAISDATKWRRLGGIGVQAINPATQSPYTLTAADNQRTFLVNSANAAMIFLLPVPVLNFSFTVKDSGGNSLLNTITIQRNAAEAIEGVAANYICKDGYGTWTFVCDGTNWYML